jgi:hypothetical protein
LHDGLALELSPGRKNLSECPEIIWSNCAILVGPGTGRSGERDNNTSIQKTFLRVLNADDCLARNGAKTTKQPILAILEEFDNPLTMVESRN